MDSDNTFAPGSIRSFNETADAFKDLDTTGKHVGIIAKTCETPECLKVDCSSSDEAKNSKCLVAYLTDEKKNLILKYRLAANYTSKPPKNTENFQLNSGRNYSGAHKPQHVAFAKTLKHVDISVVEENVQGTNFIQETEHHQKFANTPDATGLTITDKLRESFKDD